jgi:hypothetical protein
MADDQTTTTDQTAQAPAQVVFANPQDAIRAEQAAYAVALQQAQLEEKDETVEGGRYLMPNGLYVNAEGEKHKDQKSR